MKRAGLFCVAGVLSACVPRAPEPAPPGPLPMETNDQPPSSRPALKPIPLGSTDDRGQAQPPAPEEKWILVWSDEFDGPQIDRSKWTHVVAGGGFGNNEHQFYTDERENSFIENGMLVIQALRKDREGHRYTSAKMHTQHKGDWLYGRFEIRARVPTGQGIWPAIWFMPTDYEKYGGWPSCGEIDLMEAVGRDPFAVHGTLHYGNPWKNTGSHYRLPDGSRFADDFHVFALEWAPGRFEWFVDGVSYLVQTNWYTSAPGAMWPAPFDQKFYIQLNLAVGGNWPGAPDDTTPLPSRFVVDYVRVYQFTGSYPPVESRPAAPPELRPRAPLPDGNLVYNGTFDDESEWRIESQDRARGDMAIRGGRLEIQVHETGDRPWQVQVLQTRLNIERGRAYAVSFDAHSDRPRRIAVSVGKASQHWDNYSGEMPVDLGTAPAPCRAVFRMRHDTDPVARLMFQVASQKGRIWIDNVRVEPTDTRVARRLENDTRIEAEHFDDAHGVRTQPCSEGGLNVGWIETGDWTDFDVDVPRAGLWMIRARYSNGGAATGRMTIRPEGGPDAALDLPVTGDWQAWATAQAMVNLRAGPQRLRLLCARTGYNLNWVEFAPR